MYKYIIKLFATLAVIVVISCNKGNKAYIFDVAKSEAWNIYARTSYVNIDLEKMKELYTG